MIIKVFVNGSFDILHTGHLDLLNYAKSLGDYLLVATDTDDRIKLLKGSDRPVNNEANRTALLRNLKAVDEVAVFGSDEQLVSILAEYRPDVMIVGSDWKGRPVIGSEYAKQVIFYDRVNDESTTKTIQHYLDRRSM